MTTLPPGPRSVLLTTYRIGRRPMESITGWLEEYGDPFLLHAINGRVVTTADPELIRQIFANRDIELFEPFASDAMEPFFGAQSLVAMAGEAHKRERKLLTPPFHGERMRSYGEMMADATRRAFAEIEDGSEFVAIDCGTKISLEAIVRAVFGVASRELIEAHQDALLATLHAAKPIFMFSKATQVAPFGLGPWATFQRHSARSDKLLYQQIERTRGNTEGREDILSMMLDSRYDDGSSMSDADIRDELRTLLIAGHETTAISLAWALYTIHKYPEVRERLVSELDALGPDPQPSTIAKLPYLGAVIDETLRMYPIVEVVFRVLRKPWIFGGYELPAGVAVAPAISAVHRRPDIYPQPNAFRPERFLERKPKPYEYLPFGGGNRRCIGAAFSLFELRVALGTMLREFEFDLREDGEVEVERRSITMGPKGGVRMRMLRRRVPGSAGGARVTERDRRQV